MSASVATSSASASRPRPSRLIRDLSAVDRALVAIVRALTQLEDVDGGVLVLDEPTAYLPFDGVGRLFDATREAARNGTGVIFVSHRLEEITTLTDRVSVLRDGHLAGTVDDRRARPRRS